MDFGDLASTAAHDTASAIAMTAHQQQDEQRLFWRQSLHLQ